MEAHPLVINGEKYINKGVFTALLGMKEGTAAWRTLFLYLPTRTVNNSPYLLVTDILNRYESISKSTNKRINHDLWESIKSVALKMA